MRGLRRLPGFQRSPAGLEWRILKGLPGWTLLGTLLPLAWAGAAHLLLPVDATAAMWRDLEQMDYLLLGIVSAVWTAALTAGIGAVIVWLMKGPAYVADAYPLPDAHVPAAGDLAAPATADPSSLAG